MKSATYRWTPLRIIIRARHGAESEELQSVSDRTISATDCCDSVELRTTSDAELHRCIDFHPQASNQPINTKYAPAIQLFWVGQCSFLCPPSVSGKFILTMNDLGQQLILGKGLKGSDITNSWISSPKTLDYTKITSYILVLRGTSRTI
jgi:hypothetical protein